MADGLFEFVAGQLEGRSDLDKLEARGTIRLALKESGLDARSVTVEQMAVMLEKTLPKELMARGIEGAESVCGALAQSLKTFDGAQEHASAESPEDVFRRLGGR